MLPWFLRVTQCQVLAEGLCLFLDVELPLVVTENSDAPRLVRRGRPIVLPQFLQLSNELPGRGDALQPRSDGAGRGLHVLK